MNLIIISLFIYSIFVTASIVFLAKRRDEAIDQRDKFASMLDAQALKLQALWKEHKALKSKNEQKANTES